MASDQNVSHPAAKKLKMERLTAYQREQDFPGEHLRAASKDILFCDACQHTLTWERKDTVGDHLKSKKHVASKKKVAEQKRIADRARLVQATITQSLDCRTSKQEFTEDFLLAVLAGGLSLEVADTLRPFLKKWCSQAGAMPSVSGLRKTHLHQVFTKHYEQLKIIVKDKPINIVFDESCDSMDRSVLNIIGGKCLSFFFGQACLVLTREGGPVKGLIGKVNRSIQPPHVLCLTSELISNIWTLICQL